MRNLHKISHNKLISFFFVSSAKNPEQYILDAVALKDTQTQMIKLHEAIYAMVPTV